MTHGDRGAKRPRIEALKRVALAFQLVRAQELLRLALGLEYQSEKEHRGWVKRELDDRRRNAIVAKGFEIMSVYYRDLSVPALFDKLVGNIADVMGKRVRIRVRDFRFRQNVLRSRVLPPVNWGC